MGFVSSLIGANNDFQAQGPNQQQIDTANGQVSNTLGATGAFAGAAGNNNAFAMQNALAGQLAQGAAGQGPNPALAQLNQTTGQNIASQAAVQGSQRGIGANPGLLARQVAQQGGQLNQQAAGQAATLEAQQQMAYQQSLGQLLGQQVGQQQNALGLDAQASGANQSTLYGAQGNANQINSGVAAGNAATNGKIAGGILGAVGQGAAMAAGVPPTPKAHGGMIESYSQGGQTGPQASMQEDLCTPDHLAEYFSGGGQAYSDGTGPVVPGRAEMSGDNQKNDTVPAMLSPGEIVVPRSHAMDPQKAAQFAYQVALKAQRK